MSARKKSSRSKAVPLLPLGPPRSKTATVLVYSRPSGYWYARAHDATTGALITDASGYSREDVLRALRGKFVMIGVSIKSITDENPYAVRQLNHHAAKRPHAQLAREIAEALSREPRAQPTKKISDIEPGLRGVAQRSVDAVKRFMDYAMEHGRLSRGQAETALAAFRKARVIKFDAVNGTFHVKHGQFLDPVVLRRAAGIEE